MDISGIFCIGTSYDKENVNFRSPSQDPGYGLISHCVMVSSDLRVLEAN